MVAPTGGAICLIRPWADDYESITEWVKLVLIWSKGNKTEYTVDGLIFLVGHWWGFNSPSYSRVKKIVQAFAQSLEKKT